MSFNPEELFVKNIKSTTKGIDFSLGGEPAKVFMSSLIEIFKQNGGKNFLTMTFADQQENKYGVTIQNCNGTLTPQEKVKQMELEVAHLRQQVTQLSEEKQQVEQEVSYLQKSIQNLAILDGELEELDEQRELLQTLKSITYAEVLGNEAEDFDEKDSFDDGFVFPWEMKFASPPQAEKEDPLPWEEGFEAPQFEKVIEVQSLSDLLHLFEQFGFPIPKEEK